MVRGIRGVLIVFGVVVVVAFAFSALMQGILVTWSGMQPSSQGLLHGQQRMWRLAMDFHLLPMPIFWGVLLIILALVSRVVDRHHNS